MTHLFSAERISFESVINADLECLESDLIEADDKLRELKTIKHRGTFHEFVEDLIQDLEVSDIFFVFFFKNSSSLS